MCGSSSSANFEIHFLSYSYYLAKMDVKSHYNICLGSTRLTPSPKSRKAKQIACGHSFHVTCIGAWISHAESCPLCRQQIKLGSEQFPLDLQSMNTPDTVLLELHRQFHLLHKLAKEGRNSSVRKWLQSVKIRYAVELEEWDVRASAKWVHDQYFMKMLLVNNFISDSEMERYFKLFKNDSLRFFDRCYALQEFRTVDKF